MPVGEGWYSVEDAQAIANYVGEQLREVPRPGEPAATPRSPRSNELQLGKTNAAHLKNASGTIEIWAGSTKGSEADTGRTVTAYNRFADLANDVWVIIAFIGGTDWEVIAGDPCV